jgi:hypothetical protein
MNNGSLMTCCGSWRVEELLDLKETCHTMLISFCPLHCPRCIAGLTLGAKWASRYVVSRRIARLGAIGRVEDISHQNILRKTTAPRAKVLIKDIRFIEH